MPRGFFARALSPFATIFGGSPDPRLGPESNRDAMRNAILQAGLTTIQQAQQPGATALGSLATGALVGQQASQQQQGQLLQQQGREQLAQLGQAGLDIPNLRRMLVQALATGDTEAAKNITSVLTSAQAAQARLMTASMGSENIQFVQTTHPETGEAVQVPEQDAIRGDFSRAIPARPEQRGLVDARVIQDPNSPTGWSYRGFNRQLGVEQIVPGAPGPRSGTGEGGFQERQQGALAGLAETANELLRDIDKYLVSIPADFAQSPNQMVRYFGRALLKATGDQEKTEEAITYKAGVLNPAVRFMSGAQMNENEASRYERMLFAEGLESEASRLAKARMRYLLVAAMKQQQIPPASPDWTHEQVVNHVDTHMERLWQQANSDAPLPEVPGLTFPEGENAPDPFADLVPGGNR